MTRTGVWVNTPRRDHAPHRGAIPAFPLWSLALFGIDLLVIYGLAVYGGKQAA